MDSACALRFAAAMRVTLDYPPVYLALALGVAVLGSRPVPGAGGQAAAVAGGLLAIAGAALMAAAVYEMTRHRTTVIPHRQPSALVTSGIFALSRNPIYLGDVLVLLGAGFYLHSLPGLILAPVLALVLDRRFIRPEEARLRAGFGAEFERYAARTPRWIRPLP